MMSWAVTAVGRSGTLRIEILEGFDEPKRWLLALESPSIVVSIEVSGPRIVSEVLSFLNGPTISTARPRSVVSELTLGRLFGSKVRLIRDDEYLDRFFIAARPDGDEACQFGLTLGYAQVAEGIGALRDMIADLT